MFRLVVVCVVVDGRGSLIGLAMCVFSRHGANGDMVTTGGKGDTIRSKGYIVHPSPNVPQIWSCIRLIQRDTHFSSNLLNKDLTVDSHVSMLIT